MDYIPTCPICFERFGAEITKPLSLPCGHTICKSCLLKMKGTQNPMVCPMDKKPIGAEINQISPNYIVLDMIQLSNQAAKQRYYCKDHPDTEIGFLDKATNSLICAHCTLHLGKISTKFEVRTSNQIFKSAKELSDKLTAKANVLRDQAGALNQIARFQVTQSHEIIQILQNAEDLLNVRLPGDQIEKIPKSRVLINLYKLKQEEIYLLLNWIGEPEKISVNLLYRSSRDGHTAIAFHSKCDGKGPTLTIVESKSKRIFGGYTGVSWSSSTGYKADKTAFLFSISGGTKHPVINKDLAIYCESRSGPIFGAGPDFKIFEQDGHFGGHSSFGKTYHTGHCLTTKLPFTYLGGCQQFDIEAIEVYQIIKS